jgi:2-polyprenyl-3-methyl-5-hydroxy-6-metoxy-1,4-benzoquinol methylase
MLPDPNATNRALELGCGPGVPGTQVLAKRCERVTAIDLSKGQLRLARSHVPDDNVTFLHGDMVELRSFQVVSALHTLFHLSPEDQRAIITRIFD